MKLLITILLLAKGNSEGCPEGLPNGCKWYEFLKLKKEKILYHQQD